MSDRSDLRASGHPAQRPHGLAAGDPAPTDPPPGDPAVVLDRARLVDFVARLADHPTVRVEWEPLWAAFHAAFPDGPAGPLGRRWLDAALRHAAALGAVRLPSARGDRWDRAARPPLPRSVDRVVAAPGPVDPDAWRRFPWHPALAWVPTLPRLAADQQAFLGRVHAGLARGEFTLPAPLKHRSLALTGDEKRLGRLAQTTLFGPGRLSLDLLGCLPDRQPIVWEAVGAAPRVLVFENAEPFRVARDVLRATDASPYGIVAWGGGTSVAQAIQWLTEIGRPVLAIHYVGDLDRPGLDAWAAADRNARAVGLPPVEAAPLAHAAMLEAATAFGFPDGWPYDTPGPRPDDAARVDRFPAALRARVASLLALGRRVPEEVLGPTQARALWAAGGGP